jgi:hypothetical protein
MPLHGGNRKRAPQRAGPLTTFQPCGPSIARVKSFGLFLPELGPPLCGPFSHFGKVPVKHLQKSSTGITLGGSPLGQHRRGVATGVPIGVETRLTTEFERTFVRRTKKRCDCNDSDL